MKALPPMERAKRRSRLYVGRGLRTITQRELRKPCVFMHVPKCGGTSVSQALYALVPLHQKIGILSSAPIRRALALYHAGVDDVATYHDEGDHADTVAAFREQLLLMHMAHGCALVHGHFVFSDRAHAAFGDAYGYVTILRDPVARTISNYKMARRNGIFTEDFDAFLGSGMGRRMAQHALRFFSGRPTIAPGDEAAAMEAAKANMRHFAVIGFIEDLDGFTARFEAVFGARPRIGHHNRGDAGTFEMTADQRRRLDALTAPDRELTAHARRVAPGA